MKERLVAIELCITAQMLPDQYHGCGEMMTKRTYERTVDLDGQTVQGAVAGYACDLCEEDIRSPYADMEFYRRAEELTPNATKTVFEPSTPLP